jgi:hypothetical protein
MPPELNVRLERSLRPFDGDCVHNEDDLSLPQLRTILVAAIGELQKCSPLVSSFHDWHEHDGFIVDAQPDEWSRIFEAVETDRKLYDSRDDDFGVRIAFYPPNFEWLLRYNVDSEDETDYRTATCDFDLTVASNADALKILDAVAAVHPGKLTRCSAAPWFRSNYGG